MHIYEGVGRAFDCEVGNSDGEHARTTTDTASEEEYEQVRIARGFDLKSCLLYTSPSPRDGLLSRMPSSA